MSATTLVAEHAAVRPERRLAARARQILVLTAEGKSIAEIAEDLCLTPGTVKSVRQSIRRHLRLPRGVLLDREILHGRIDVAAVVADAERIDDHPTVNDDQRNKHLLRLSLAELEQLTNRVSRRATLLGNLASGDSSSPVEAAELGEVARSLSDLNAAILNTLRAEPGAEPGALDHRGEA